MVEDICKKHSGIDHEISNLKQSDDKQWTCIDELVKGKASNSFVRWVIGIGLVLSLAVVGFLWGTQREQVQDMKKGQTEILLEVKESKTEAASERKKIQEKMGELKDQVKDLQRDINRAR